MSIHDNGRGRCYALCDVDSCHSCVIDLPPDRAACARIVVAFFGWSTRAWTAPDGGRRVMDACPLHPVPKEPRARRRRVRGLGYTF